LGISRDMDMEGGPGRDPAGPGQLRAATVEHIRTLELPGRVLRVAVQAGKPEWSPPRQPW